MSEQEIVRILARARFKFRSDTLENWATENPILLSGELDEYSAKYKTQLFAKAEQSYKTSGYDTAVSVLQEGLFILNADDEIQQKIQYYNNSPSHEPRRRRAWLTDRSQGNNKAQFSD